MCWPVNTSEPSECQRMCVYMSLLFSAMLVHGYNPNDMLSSVIVSIPKDAKESLCNSSNYRGIALCSTLSKILDYIILKKYKNELSSSNMQYAFKERHSTVMCCMVLKDVTTYYVNRGSNVFACLLDASKAFDLVNYGKLFKLLIKRKLPAAVIRLILDSYMRQTVRCTWNGQYSEPFNTMNGIKQGAVLSPVLFSVYLDVLLLNLEKHGIGCRIGNYYYGALAYADDITLICPSLKGLQKMVDICEDFSHEYGLKFNEKKSMCIKFGKECVVTNITLAGKNIKWKKQSRTS